MQKFKILLFLMIFTFETQAVNQNVYDFSFQSINNKEINLMEYTGKTLLIVNVASNCGFTKQYAGLQSLWDKYKTNGLVVIGVPSNDFNQELDTNNKIKEFCETNFGITFPMTTKVKVKGKNAHPFYLWAKKTYGSSAAPKWNFYKILINKKGEIEDTYSSLTAPMSSKIIKKINKIL